MSAPMCFALILVVYGLAHASLIKPMKAEDGSFDWRTKGVISPVRNMGSLGSVVAFVITEGVESLHAIQTKQPVEELSVLEAADCCTDQWRQPKYKGFQCIPAIGGMCTPQGYHGGKGVCNNATCTPVAFVTGTKYLPANDEAAMKEAIHQSPLTAYIDAGVPSFQAYSSGIYSDPVCTKQALDHMVQIVGYGTEGGKDYWIIKNTWSVNWGEKGYMRIERGTNMCGIASKVFYPVNDK